ncbi:hypothetical protein L3Q82_007107 [Scortum barcoo]|uniref:Uncharacterized protein n=1 Tax=Scortum barcoo TaxID=214431 RepID=A0ACB8WSG4_9TELE|nr:hypothetical protein L3Q82_007107 [Scortum barcoo]
MVVSQEPTGRRAHVRHFGLSPAGSRGQRPGHQALACMSPNPRPGSRVGPQLIMDFVEPILSIITQIYSLAENVKANKDRCQRVAQRSKALQELVLTIKQRGPGQISTPLENALRELCASLEEAKTLMMKFSQTKGVKSFWKSGSHEEKFNKVNERLTDNFQVLSGALQIEHGTMLSKVYQTVSGRSFDEEYYSGQDLTTPTSPTPVPSPVPQMPVSSPTNPTAPPAIMPQMPVSSPTNPTAPPAIMPQMPVSSPTSPQLQSHCSPRHHAPNASFELHKSHGSPRHHVMSIARRLSCLCPALCPPCKFQISARPLPCLSRT